MTGVLPFVVTALIALLFLPIFGILPLKDAMAASFGDPLILFFIGVMLVSAAFGHSQLSKRLARTLISHTNDNTSTIILIFTAIGALLGMWITEVAAAALLTPLAVEIAERAGSKRMESNFGKALLMACAWGPLIGGMGTPVGSGSNVLAISLLQQYANVQISFLQWMAIGIPLVIVLIPIAWLLIVRAFPPEMKRVDMGLDAESQPISRAEIATGLIFLMMIILWLLGPSINTMTNGAVDLNLSNVAILGGILLFLPGIDIFDWKTAEKKVDWGGIILIVAGLALGKAAFNTGAARWLAYVIASGLHVNLLPLVGLSVFAVLTVSIIHLCFSSNTVTGSVMVPLMIAMSAALGVSPWFLAIPAAFSACTAFILVPETPTSIIPYSAGFFSLKDMAGIGIVMTLVVATVVGTGIYLINILMGV
jgi:sodium-dependent dicarboxylate transporter 2/3/5